MSDRHSPRATRALTRLAEVDPAFAALALWVHHRDTTAGVAHTDGRRIFYGPGFEALTLAEQVGVAAHHLAHVAFRHVPRSQAMRMRHGERFDAALFNLAADAILNEVLLLAGHVLPRPCPRLVPLLAEALGQRVTPGEAVGDWDVERLYLALQGPPGTRGGGDGAEDTRGSGAAERARAQAARQGFTPDLDTTAAEPGEADAGQGDWPQRLSRALAEGRLAGRGIGALGHRIADLPDSRIPWERHLRGLLARALQPDPGLSWQRPTGRWLAAEAEARRTGTPVPVFEPGRRGTRSVPRIVLGIDSSSSVDGATLALFAAQVAGIGRRCRGEVHVLVFDTEVRSACRMQGIGWAAEVVQLRFSRDGGTAYPALFERAMAMAPSALVVLTDLDAALPERPGRLPVVWAVPRPLRVPPPWGRVVTLDR